jgi:hypothetical protein
MTLDEYNELKLQDELQIGTDFTDEYENYEEPDYLEEDSYVDGLLTDGFREVYDPLDELFGEPIAGYSLQ